MRRSRVLVRAAALAVGVVLLATPVAAQSVNRALIDELNTQLFYVALPLTLFVELTLLYAIYRFRDNDDPTPTVDDPALEITWTTATAVILVFVGVSGYFVMTNPYITAGALGAPGTNAAGGAASDVGAGSDEVVVHVRAYQWGWEIRYPEANATLQNRIVLPVGRDVRFVLRTDDVIHSFYVPALGVKQDIFPGQRQIARTRATETGTYRLHCAELCGVGHARMDGTVTVLNRSAYDQWISEQATGSANATGAAATGANSTSTATTRTSTDGTESASG